MINAIIEAISIALNAEFDEKDYGMDMEEIKQDLREPCFFITCLSPTNRLFFGKRYFLQNQFVIQYFPESEEELQRECNAVAERMTWCLEYITAKNGDKLRGTKMRYQIIDGVLHFFVNYDCFVYRAEQKHEPMETLESDTDVKGGD